ncbi:hypothetical protein HYH02_011219 [Chlamydomonas schloesseri]|uniref:Uncharacterized protein n=1 Tax=Chlamydomonas schloesseri TaxID=2026947 RepID=A0A835W582_9CHLO|nr:hypothetical protein HYH02_011219 [Chlamydomonas schloesseri]|eukprot:KAG2437579.1 hypothetical protein HYH02_011219 [Chlamydomonas schloesseri]
MGDAHDFAELDTVFKNLLILKPQRVAVRSMRKFGQWLATLPINNDKALLFLTSPPITTPGEAVCGSESARVAHRRMFTLTTVIKYTPGLRVQQHWLRAMGELCGVSTKAPGGRRWFAMVLRQLLPAAAGSPTAVWPAKTRQLLQILRLLFVAEGAGCGAGDFASLMAATFQSMREQAALCGDAPRRLRQLERLLDETEALAAATLPVAPAA